MDVHDKIFFLIEYFQYFLVGRFVSCFLPVQVQFLFLGSIGSDNIVFHIYGDSQYSNNQAP